MAFVNTFNIAADITAMGASAKLVVPLPAAVLTVGMTALMLTLEVTIPYHRYSQVLRWLALSLLTYLFVLASINVDWGRSQSKRSSAHISGVSSRSEGQFCMPLRSRGGAQALDRGLRFGVCTNG